MAEVPLTAALAGVPGGVQGNGLWIGRRQLFIRFAAEAETATMYTPDALAAELGRLLERSAYHSVSVSGRDPLSGATFLRAAFEKYKPAIPIVLDCDGQRPDAVAEVARFLTLLQVTLDGTPSDPGVDQAVATLKSAAGANLAHALVLAPNDATTDGQLMRVISRVHAGAPAASLVVHPSGESLTRNRRWLTFMERAVALHSDLRLFPRLPRPTGTY